MTMVVCLNDMEIRRYNNDDLSEIISLFKKTVHLVNIRDYTQEQVDVWAPDSIDMEEWDNTLSRHHTFVAVKDSIIVGFGDIDYSGFLDRLYVHHKYQRQGVGTKICDKLECTSEPGLTIRTHASISARPFFFFFWYKVVKVQSVERNGIFLKNYIMELCNSGKSSLS